MCLSEVVATIVGISEVVAKSNGFERGKGAQECMTQ